MSDGKVLRSSTERITIGILLALVGTNAVWVATSKYSGPLMALIFYALVAFLCWRRSHFQVGVIGGIFGLGIHIYELIFQGTGELEGIDLGLLLTNLILPIPLVYFSYRAYQEVKNRGAEVQKKTTR